MIELDTDELLRVLCLGGVASERRATVPVLGCVRLTFNGRLSVQSTNCDQACVAMAEISGGGGEPFDLCLPSHEEVRKALLAAGGPTTMLSVEGQTLTIASGSLNIRANCLPASEMPTLWENGRECFSVLAGPEFVSALNRARAAMSDDRMRYYLSGLHISEGSTTRPGRRVVGCDGHRLHVIPIEFENATDAIPPNLIIPRAAIEMLVPRLTEAKASLRFSVWKGVGKEGTLVSFTTHVDGTPWVVFSKGIDGAYPNYETVIPVDHKFRFTVEARALRGAVLALSAPFRKRKDGTAAVRFDVFKDGTARLSAAWTGAAVGHAEASIPISGLTGEPSVFGFNGAYVADMLTAFEGDAVEFLITDGASPALVRDPESAGPFVVLMPLRVG